jgi:Polyketide cyclase / dehydrase and lipid transport
MTTTPSTSPARTSMHGPTVVLAVAGGVLAAFTSIALGVLLFRTYGVFVFIATPFVMGAVTGYLLARGTSATPRQTAGVILVMLASVTAGILCFAFEGLICVLMAAPLAIPLALTGGVVGRAFADERQNRPTRLLLSLLVLPAGAVFDSTHLPDRDAHEVRSVVQIDAPAERVWENVIAFPALPEPTEWWFRAGIAYPRYASIEGSGVGAIRYCVFSTGPFVEPITVWEPGRRLAFNVTSFPEPMRELSPYSIHPPHLDGYLRSRHGEFRLIPLAGGRTRLEGRTWYELDMAPAIYWEAITDGVIHSIHRRVLDHIKRESERPAGPATARSIEPAHSSNIASK